MLSCSGKDKAGVVLTCKASSSVEDIEEICIIHGVRINSLGSVGGDRLEIDGADFGSLDDYRMMYDNAIGNLMQSESELVSDRTERICPSVVDIQNTSAMNRNIVVAAIMILAVSASCNPAAQKQEHLLTPIQHLSLLQ